MRKFSAVLSFGCAFIWLEASYSQGGRGGVEWVTVGALRLALPILWPRAVLLTATTSRLAAMKLFKVNPFTIISSSSSEIRFRQALLS